ncbi:PP2C family protein-serine/threonine phosphatase [Plantactinospora sp. CA-294935]|uniref:PP2C family protein-serine/threonine phosphatase n=1 Tax=Plantactinospora sp. CA-294935 TaxID=3240012 RepID=UPI003D94F79B
MIDPEVRGSTQRLRQIEAVVDAALSHSAADELLDELLDRVRELLGADTAAVLLLDDHAQQLVATATRGLEEEVRQGIRIPLGQGFAGRIAATREPVILDRVDTSNVVNPILLDAGVRSLVGVPMFAADDVVGVLHVGSLYPRQFTADDVELLQTVAERAGPACRTRSNRIHRAAALALQHSLVPSRLPRIPGLEMAARYVPGHDAGVGGDWYDVFTLPSGWLGIVIGDVSGHGLPAAVVMGRIRSALRAYALVCDDPAEALTLLDRKIYHFEAGSLATVLYAMVPPDRTRILISLAGHLQPVISAPGEPSRVLDLPIGQPVGLGRDQPQRQYSEIQLPADTTAIFYTDGLVERRGEIIDTGIERLRTLAEAGPPEALCAHIVNTLAAPRRADDIAILVVRTNP